MPFPTATNVPAVDTVQMIEVDRAMMHDYKIALIQMMENAGRCLAHVARARFFDGDPRGKSVVVLAGTGGNGGGALVAARRLHNYGANVQVYIAKPGDAFAPIPAHQLDIVRRMGLTVGSAENITSAPKPNLILDGVIGYSLKGNPRGGARDLIRWANASGAPILALDAPSGIDTATGRIFEPAIQAVATMTLALPKKGLQTELVAAHVGELYLADISVPPELYSDPALALQVGHIFAESDIVRLT